jgi:hypothetical protein
MADEHVSASPNFIVLPPTPEPISLGVFIVIDILSALLALFGLCGGWQDAVQALAQKTQDGFNQVGDVFSWLGGYAEGLFKPLASLFDFIWKGIILGLISHILNALRSLHQWLESKLGPIIAALHQMRVFLDRNFNLYIKPILNVIQKARQFLVILRALGVKWAGKLDQRLLKVETDITTIFLGVRGFINGSIDILNAIADPLGLLRRPSLVLSLRRVFNTSVTAFAGRGVGTFFPTPPKTQQVPPVTGGTKAAQPAYSGDNGPSSYFSDDDGLGDFGGYSSGNVIPDSAVDSVNPLDYFNQDLWPGPVCSDPVACAQQALQQITAGGTVSTQ